MHKHDGTTLTKLQALRRHLYRRPKAWTIDPSDSSRAIAAIDAHSGWTAHVVGLTPSMQREATFAYNSIFHRAAEGSDSFRQWVYPDPPPYDFAITIIDIVEQGALTGMVGDDIVHAVIAAFKEDERRRLCLS